MELWTAFVIGLLGSFHCIGMCGPIVLALPPGEQGNIFFVSGRLLYNVGRVFTYALLGAVFGLLGSGISVAGLQQWASISLGVVILLVVLLPSKYKQVFIDTLQFSLLTSRLKNYFGKLFKKSSQGSLLLIGIVNGFLPCGFVYIGIAGAIATGSFINGILYMALFGAGTIPIMFSVSIAGNFISLKLRKKISRLIPVLALILAIIFILRGLNLGVPYLSPKLMKSNTEQNMNMQHH